jgi:hypothetical protein
MKHNRSILLIEIPEKIELEFNTYCIVTQNERHIGTLILFSILYLSSNHWRQFQVDTFFIKLKSTGV